MPPSKHFLDYVPMHPRAAEKWEKLTPLAREIVSFEVIAAIMTRRVHRLADRKLPSGRRAVLFLVDIEIGSFFLSLIPSCDLLVLNDFALSDVIQDGVVTAP
jgi:hypothetical protein